MATSDTGWQIDPDAEDEQAYQALGTDRIWNGYSIADLDPPYRVYTRVAVAHHAMHGIAACLVLQHPAFASIIPTGMPDGLAAILQTVELPSYAFVLARSEHLAMLAEHYQFVAKPEQMIRMWVDAASFQPAAIAAPVEPLGMADHAALEAFYAAYPASSFNADQLATGPFYGVREQAALVASRRHSRGRSTFCDRRSRQYFYAARCARTGLRASDHSRSRGTTPGDRLP